MKNRSLLRQIYEARKSDTPPITGAEVMYITAGNQFLDKKDATKFLKEIVEKELPGREAKPSSDTRLMIVGSENDDIKFLEMVEDLSAVIVIDDHCTGSRYFWD